MGVITRPFYKQKQNLKREPFLGFVLIGNLEVKLLPRNRYTVHKVQHQVVPHLLRKKNLSTKHCHKHESQQLDEVSSGKGLKSIIKTRLGGRRKNLFKLF